MLDRGVCCFEAYRNMGLPLWLTVVKSLPAVRETRVGSLSGEDPLENGIAIHSSIPAWIIPRTHELVSFSPWGRRVGHG